MNQNSVFRANARAQLGGSIFSTNWLMALLVCLIGSAIIGVANSMLGVGDLLLTAFFTYGMLWGVNNGILPAKTYKPVIDKAWKYLTEVALQADGSVGYVQPIGEKPDPTRKVDARSQAPFGTGAWLLAACEYVNYVNK